MKKMGLTAALLSMLLVLSLSIAVRAQTTGTSGMPHGTTGSTPTTSSTTAQQEGAKASQSVPSQMGMNPGMMGMGSGMMGMNPGMMGMGSGMTGMGMGSGMMGLGGGYGYLGYLKESLGLTGEQYNTIYSVLSDAQKEIIKQFAEIRIAQLELWEKIRSPKVDMAAVKDALKKLQDLRSALWLSQIEKREKIKSVLTPEQFEKFFQYYPWGLGGRGMSHESD